MPEFSDLVDYCASQELEKLDACFRDLADLGLQTQIAAAAERVGASFSRSEDE